jgi:hypothetical protein
MKSLMVVAALSCLPVFAQSPIVVSGVELRIGMGFNAVNEKLRGKVEMKKVPHDNPDGSAWCVVKKDLHDETAKLADCILEGTTLEFLRNKLVVINKTLGMDANERLATAFNYLFTALHEQKERQPQLVELFTEESTAKSGNAEARNRIITLRVGGSGGKVFQITINDPIGKALLRSNITVSENAYAQ